VLIAFFSSGHYKYATVVFLKYCSGSKRTHLNLFFTLKQLPANNTTEEIGDNRMSIKGKAVPLHATEALEEEDV
jgi:hypothetical protein